MKRQGIVTVLAVSCGLVAICGYRIWPAAAGAPRERQRVAVVVPVNIRAINTFTESVTAELEPRSVEVKEFSAEGDAARFESVIKAAMLTKPDVLILFGTQLTDTALGPQFRPSLPKTIAAAILSPEMIEGVSEIGSSPPRKLPIAFVTDTPRRDIYAQSASVIKELLQTRSQVVGVLYNESEKNSEETATRLRDALQQVGITVHLGLLTGPDDVLAATKALIIKGCRLVVIPHDKYALPKAAAVVKLCLEALPDEPIPVFSLDDGVVRDSGVAASVSVSYSILGRVTAELCRQILSGADPASLPVVTLDEAIVFVNQPALQKCRCTLSAATLQRAVVVDTTPSP